MPATFIDQKKLTEVLIGLFGILSVYIIYGLIDERIIMTPYESILTK